MKSTILIATIILLFNGCSMMIGKEDFSCKNSEDLKDAGICGSSMYILQNKKSIEKDAYVGFVKKNGTYMKIEDCNECDNNEEKIKEIEQW